MSNSPYADLEKTTSKNLPPHLDKLVSLLKMQDLMADIHNSSLQIDSLDVTPMTPWVGLPPPPPPAIMRPCDARAQVWDAWETGDWGELNRQFQTISDLWVDMKGTLDPILEDVGNGFRKGGKKAA